LAPDTYTVTPSLTGYVFIPSDQSVPVTNANVPGINFVGYNYTISGTVTDTDGNGLPGVTVTASGTPTSATTDFDGTYTLYVVAGTYTVTPSLTGYDFTPSNQSVPATNANVPGINFVIHSYSISGTVTHANGEGFAGVGVVAVGTSTYTEATTDFFGNYTIGPLAPDTYVVYPSLTGYVFTPSDQSVPVTNADVPGIDFTVVPPVVVSTTPANNATGVKVRTKIKVVFSHPMNEAATQSAFSLSALTGVFGWSTDGQTLTFTSLGALAYGTNYVISVRSSAQSAVGVPLTPSYSSHFRTVYRPVVVSTTPANNATGVAVGTQITVVFSQTMNKSATQGAFSLKNGTALVAGTFSWGTLNKPMTFTPSAPLLPATKYTLTITTSAKSVVTNLAAPYSSQFTTAPAPVVVSATPANNATGVALSAPVTVTFSEAMTPVVTHNAFSLKNGTTIVAGTFSWDPLGKSMTFTPSAKLLPATNYTLTITTGAQSATGGPLAAPYSAQFTTAPPPTVLATWPANNVTGAAVNAPVQVSFSEAMLPVVTQNAFRLKNGTTSVAGAFSWSQLYKLMTFTPKAALLPATTYMLTITTGAQSAVGGPLAAPYPAQFTTGAAPASAAAVAALAAPVLAAPEDGATGVSASPRLAWEAVAGAAGYLVQVATDEGFTSKVFVAQVTDVQQQLRGLAAGSVYYWRVQAYTNDTTSPWSEVGTFTTGSG
jgi:methionine-rich copper-binding protein CopC